MKIKSRVSFLYVKDKKKKKVKETEKHRLQMLRGLFSHYKFGRRTNKFSNMMRKEFFCLSSLAVFQISVLTTAVSCTGTSGADQQEGCMRISFPEDMYKAALQHVELPDTNDFILDIRSSSGETIYSGFYGDSPESLPVPSGSYTVSVKSSDFSRPQFSRPLFGDEQCVVVPSGSVINVRLECRQVNSGIRLRISPDFLEAFPDGVLFVSSDDGRLMYGYNEDRIAYFNPGPVSVVLDDGKGEKTLLTRSLESQEILTIGIQVSDDMLQGEDGISISIDTTRIWTDEDYVIGKDESDKGGNVDDAMSVNQARDNIGAEDVWVCGYIVGGDLSRTSVSFTPPFSSDSNLAIAGRSSVSSRESCIAVSVPAGDIRDRLGLVEHPENVGRRVCVRGDIVGQYFGLVGIKNVTDCVLK